MRAAWPGDMAGFRGFNAAASLKRARRVRKADGGTRLPRF